MRYVECNSSKREDQRHDIVFSETKPVLPSRSGLEKMAKRRFQDPKPVRHGNSWTLLYWRDEFVGGEWKRRRVRESIAPGSLPYREAQKIAAEKMRPLNRGLETIGSAIGFEIYVTNTYIPINLPLMASTTRQRYKGVLKNYLVPAFKGCMLRDMTPLSIQRFISSLAESDLSHESKDKIRDVLSSVMTSAISYGMLARNPVENVKIPPSRKGKSRKPHMTVQEFNNLVELIPEPYATMVYVAVYTGLRVSELSR
jgi:Phage integrase, N-terminal SAM-like domain